MLQQNGKDPVLWQPLKDLGQCQLVIFLLALGTLLRQEMGVEAPISAVKVQGVIMYVVSRADGISDSIR